MPEFYDNIEICDENDNQRTVNAVIDYDVLINEADPSVGYSSPWPEVTVNSVTYIDNDNTIKTVKYNQSLWNRLEEKILEQEANS